MANEANRPPASLDTVFILEMKMVVQRSKSPCQWPASFRKIDYSSIVKAVLGTIIPDALRVRTI